MKIEVHYTMHVDETVRKALKWHRERDGEAPHVVGPRTVQRFLRVHGQGGLANVVAEYLRECAPHTKIEEV